ncbi:MAG: ubiquinol-cytochrome c reductase iron-sulfur subunit [Myxococcota bacterium]
MADDEKVLDRRGFFGRALGWLGWGSLCAWAAGSSAALLRFVAPAVRYELPRVFKIGRPDEYKIGEVSTRFKDDYQIFVVRTQQGIYALHAQCTHLGCTTNWFQQDRLIKCPCHGTNFSPEGDVLSGPAPAPLRRAAVSLAPDGRIVVDTSEIENRPGRRESARFLVKV